MRINLLVWAGGKGTRLRPITWEYFPKGTLPLAGETMISRVVRNAVEGIRTSGFELGQILVSTTPEGRRRVQTSLSTLGPQERRRIRFSIAPYDRPGERFLKGLASTVPTLSCNDDKIVRPSAIKRALATFGRLQRTVVAVSSRSYGLRYRSRYHSALTVYSKDVRPVAKELVNEWEDRRGIPFEAYHLASYLRSRNDACFLKVGEPLNVNSATGYLKALHSIIGSGSFVSPSSRCARESRLRTVAVEGKCVIGKVQADSVVFFPDCRVGDGAVISHCIVAPHSRILPGTHLAGTVRRPNFIGTFLSECRNSWPDSGQEQLT